MGVRSRLCKKNQALKIQYIEEPILAPKSLGENYIDALRTYMKTKNLKKQALTEIGLSAGLRVPEVTNLKISDLKLNKRGGEIYVKVGKGFKFRTVPIAPDLVVLLKEYCSDLLDSGMKLTDVALVAGHLKKNGMPNIATTTRYVLSRQDKLVKAVRKMQKSE